MLKRAWWVLLSASLQGHNAFIRKNLNHTTFSAEAGNLYNKHSYKYSGALGSSSTCWCISAGWLQQSTSSHGYKQQQGLGLRMETTQHVHQQPRSGLSQQEPSDYLSLEAGALCSSTAALCSLSQLNSDERLLH